MTVVRFPNKTIETKAGLSLDRITKILENLGMPCGVIVEELEVELTPNRLDMVGINSLSYTIRLFEGIQQPIFISSSGMYGELTNEKPKARPFIRAFVVKNVKDREFLYDNLIQMQEKLHATLGRKRKKVAIGIHDLEKVKFPLRYAEVKEIKFVPLGWEREAGIKEILEKHEKGKIYAHLLEGFDKVPMLFDEEGVISFPPIINSERTKISEETVNFLVDITGTHEETLKEVERILCTEFALAGGEIYSVKINNSISPDLTIKELKFDKKEVEDILGISVEGEEELLRRMGHVLEGDTLKVAQNRYDMRSIQDIAEEIAISIGYDKFPKEMPEVPGMGKANEEEEFVERVKHLLASYGLVESYGFFLTSREDSEYINESNVLENTLNPLSSEASTLRGSVLTSLLKVHSINKRRGLPQAFFEVGRVNSKREKREFLEVGITLGDKKSNVEMVVAWAKRFLYDLNIDAEFSQEEERITKVLDKLGLRKNVFVLQRSGSITSKEGVGIVGELNPEVLERFKVDFPISAFVFRFLNHGPGGI